MGKIALVIGNSKYSKIDSLKNAVNDAVDISAKLRTLGFEVEEKHDLTLNQMTSSINDFVIKLANKHVGLLYYAGHGMQINDRNYIIPTDFVLSDNESTSAVSCYKMSDFYDKIQNFSDKINIIILDACRDNPFSSSIRGNQKPFFTLNELPPTGTIIGFSTKNGYGASDGDKTSSNGLYTGILKEYIDTPNITILELFQRTRTKVLELSGRRQEPWEYTSLTGNFYFKIKTNSSDDYSDEDIYSFIKRKGDEYESEERVINDVECLPYIDAQRKFNLSIIELLRSYSRVQNRLQNNNFSDEDIDELNIRYLSSWGFKYINYRWYYKKSYVKMGDPLPLSKKLRHTEPEKEKEIVADMDLDAIMLEGKLRISVTTNLPQGTPLICSLRSKKGKYSAQAKLQAHTKSVTTEGFTNKGQKLSNGTYSVSVTCPINSVLKSPLKEVFGERNRNLVGEYVKFTPIGGNTFSYKDTIYINDDTVLVLG